MKHSSSFITAFIAMVLLAPPLMAKEAGPVKSPPDFAIQRSMEAMGPPSTVMNINNFLIWVRRDGYFPYSIGPHGSVGQYPIGTANIVFGEGMVWGAKVTDDNTSTRVRVGGSTYAVGLKAGKVLYDGSGNPIGSEDPNDRHAWRVRKDWESADLKPDASHFFQVELASVTDADVAEIYEQYEYDWENWPAEDGAPYEELNGVAGYQPATWDTSAKAWVNGDVPGEPGAAQTIWIVANDLPTIEGGDTTHIAQVVYGSPPIGLEEQLTMWAYDFASTHALGNVLFKRARMIYAGLPGNTPGAVMDTVYFTQWSDPDLGTYTDDYVGCDTSLSLGYVYNGNATDGIYLGDYGLPVAAGGYDFLQGPIVEGDTLGMTSFTYFGAGSSISDPTLGVYSGALQFFNLMEGYLPRPEYPEQDPWVDPITGEETKFALAGDPVTGIGWLDGIQLPPGDRRLVMSTGPFVMAQGDTQDIVLATVAGIGKDNISSVTVLKFYDTFAQYAYDNDFVLPNPPPAPNVKATSLDGRIVLDWGFDYAAIKSTEETVSLGFVFEGYNVYQLPKATSPLSDAERVATFDKVNLIQAIFDPGIDPASGFVVDQIQQSGTNSGVQRFFSTDEDAIRGRPISNSNPLYFTVTAYSYLSDFVGSPFKTLESSPSVISIVPDIPLPGDALGAEHAEEIDVTHTGTADGYVEVNVVSPDDLTGDDYEVHFDQQHYYRDVDGIWKPTAYEDSVGKRLDKAMDISPTTVTGSAIASATVGTIDLTFTMDLISPDGDWVDGFMLTLPAGMTINSATMSGAYGHYPEYGQVCENIPSGLITGRTIFWGDSSRSTLGCIEGDIVFTVNVDLFTFPATVSYHVYDDGYGGNVVDAVGTVTLTELGYEFKTEKHWNLLNATTGDTLLEDQTVMNGTDLYTGEIHTTLAAPQVDGFQINVAVNYAAPEDFTDLDDVGSGSYDIDSYMASGWSATALCADPDVWGCGSDDIDLLQRDIELRFTGVYDTPETTIVGTDTLIVRPIAEGTGSLATFVGSRNWDTGDHPMNPNPGSDENFAIRIPFEVWDLDAEGGPAQIDFLIYDRMQVPEESGNFAGDFYAFNPYDRMYCYVLHRAYSEDTAAVAAPTCTDAADYEYLTWNLVFWETDWVTGDVITIQYDNPIQLGSDVFSFSTGGLEPTEDDAALEKAAVEKINVYPNPYYGFHALETSRQGKWVKITHLPEKADIRIFNLGGTMVKVIRKDDATQYAQWNLKNQSGYPVASGIYIIHIDMPDIKMSKILKLAVVQEEQILTRY